MRYLIGAMTTLLIVGALTVQSHAADLLSGNESNTVQLSLANLGNVIASSPVSLGALSVEGGAAGFATGDISGLTPENSGGINVMMVNAGTLSNQPSVVSTSAVIGDLPEIQSLISGTN
jgi:hypothetical protein